jgi:hypothetical protein
MLPSVQQTDPRCTLRVAVWRATLDEKDQFHMKVGLSFAPDDRKITGFHLQAPAHGNRPNR